MDIKQIRQYKTFEYIFLQSNFLAFNDSKEPF